MKRLLKVLMWLALAMVVVVALVIAGSYVNHRVQTPREEAAHPPPGQLVAVNGHRLHVYAEGQGQSTLVFLSGSATAAPVLDFKGLYSRLSDEYRTVVVERAGYGWSDDSGGVARDIETVVEESRSALRSAGESPPYVLLPHSMSGLEALHWASRHPDEVVAIVGLDPSTPRIYEEPPPSGLMLSMISLAGRTGLIRLAPSLCRETPAIRHLDAEEADAYCSLVYRRTLTDDMRAEIDITQANADAVAAEGIPDVPMYLFISTGEGLPVGWVEVLMEYAEAAGGRYERLDVGHYVHGEDPDVIATRTRDFLHELGL
ncbi:MAG: alpha/beta hydrolase [Actinomycetales bacterium]|nr:alpha/beta hydrolase [Actinomycetales bacterium]